MVLIPACERRPLPTLGTALPSGVGTRSPRAPIPGAGPAKPPRGPFVLCEQDNGRHSQTSSHGSGPVKGPRLVHTEASVRQRWGGQGQGRPGGTPPTFSGCCPLQGASCLGQAIPEQRGDAPQMEP